MSLCDISEYNLKQEKLEEECMQEYFKKLGMYNEFKFLLNQENLDDVLYERLCKYFCKVIGV